MQFFTETEVASKFEKLVQPYIHPCQGVIAFKVQRATLSYIVDDFLPFGHYGEDVSPDTPFSAAVGISLQELIPLLGFGRFVRSKKPVAVFRQENPSPM